MKISSRKIIEWYIKRWYVVAAVWLGWGIATVLGVFGKNNQYNPLIIPVRILEYFSTDPNVGNIVFEIMFFPAILGSYISQDILKAGEGGFLTVPLFAIILFFLTCYIAKRLLEKIKTV